MFDKIQRIQKDLKAPKNKKNEFGGFNYRSLEDILVELKPLLEREGMTMTIEDDMVNCGNKNYVKATVKIYGEGGIQFNHSAFAREAEAKSKFDEPQLTGSASSYARKYALGGLFLIDNDDVDPDQHSHEPIVAKKVIPKASFGHEAGKEKKEMFNLVCERCGKTHRTSYAKAKTCWDCKELEDSIKNKL